MAVRHFLIAVAASTMLMGAAEKEPALPGWMAGCWEQNAGDRWTEECWTGARGGMMLGSSRSGKGESVDLWEAMQIIAAPSGDGMTFWASPNGVKRTPFAWRADATSGVTFHNRENDYPQRVRYWREGDLLIGEIAMADGSRAVRWEYKRK
ncbi:DUF6265 family protein [Sphingomonas cavernae]|uniref:DUF6265 domain-containing protein n=1 Tax=Sphingomonas cavernae TaxID=2320861 RepID=A0A418W669_9SPHN|nr:DUF6265 family protein [Sphingomonas cavernae]RJF85530.1 hypothetical protein D3876_16515 [Sphingomonas cavernae]